MVRPSRLQPRARLGGIHARREQNIVDARVLPAGPPEVALQFVAQEAYLQFRGFQDCFSMLLGRPGLFAELVGSLRAIVNY